MGKTKRELTLEEKYVIEQERERQKRALADYQQTGHGTPKTRREFLASGVIGTAAFIAAPSILELVLREQVAQAQAAGICPSGSPGLSPFIHLNFSGGGGLAGNFVPMDKQGQLLPSYARLSLGTPNNFSVAREFNNAPFAALNDGTVISQMLAGIRARTSQATRDKTAFVGICVRSQDDSDSNKFSIAGLVQAAGLKGTDLPNLGRVSSLTGVSQQPALRPPSAPLIVNNFNSINGALQAGGALNTLSSTQKQSLVGMIRKLSSAQKANLASSSSGKTLANLVDCATQKNVELSTATGAGIDPRQDANMRNVWGFAANANQNDPAFVMSAVVYNALNGKAGSAGIQIGGYDYHGQSRAQQDAKDLQGGEMIGRILESAALMNTPVFIHVTSDGSVDSVVSNNPQSQWVGDNGPSGMSFIIAFHPNGRPATKGFQIGSFNSAQAAEETIMTGWNAEKSAVAVFANYMQFSGKLSAFHGIQGGQIQTQDLDKILMIG